MVKNNDNWRIWNKNDSVEQRTFKRVKNELPEMECAKQLTKIISDIYKPEMKILDIGCASGHYYNSIKKIDKNIIYCGLDSTKTYIDFAKNYFKNNDNVSFILGDLYNLPKSINSKFDICFCCNVLLHLPSLEEPLKKLIETAKKYCIVRTLISDKTHLSKYLYSDKFDNEGNPLDFVYQNTYSYNFIKQIISSVGNYKVEFIDDKFDQEQINKEFNKFDKIQNAVTKAMGKIQIAGSKIFQWKWVVITK